MNWSDHPDHEKWARQSGKTQTHTDFLNLYLGLYAEQNAQLQKLADEYVRMTEEFDVKMGGDSVWNGGPGSENRQACVQFAREQWQKLLKAAAELNVSRGEIQAAVARANRYWDEQRHKNTLS